jgi:cysteine-rich repeat protein
MTTQQQPTEQDVEQCEVKIRERSDDTNSDLHCDYKSHTPADGTRSRSSFLVVAVVCVVATVVTTAIVTNLPIANRKVDITASGETDSTRSTPSNNNGYTSAYLSHVDPTERSLFISEYIEGGSYNKAIEIYNPTESDVSLSSYTIHRATNGGPWSNNVHSFQAPVLAAGDALTICHSKITGSATCDEYDDTLVTWNGNDAVGLFRESILIDSVGTPNTNPGSGGWSVVDQQGGPFGSTKDHTLIRTASVFRGNIEWSVSASSEWDVHPRDSVAGLGVHTITASTVSPTASPTASPTVPAVSGGSLYIAEYVEGSGYTKALGLRNPGPGIVTLRGWSLGRVTNGGRWSEATYDLSETITLKEGCMWALCHPNFPVTSNQDQCNAFDSTFVTWNGDDAIGLFYEGVLVDSVGEEGVDPGTNWPVGSGSTKDYTLRRRTQMSNPTWTPMEWDVYSKDTINGLGLCIDPPSGICGDGAIGVDEGCDDGNPTSDDGCSDVCVIETDFTCAGEPSECTSDPVICGDGVVVDAENCDDGNLVNGDGCNSTCGIEAGHGCLGGPSVCSVIPVGCNISTCTDYTTPGVFADCLRTQCYVGKHTDLGYGVARSLMYCNVFNSEQENSITGVYGGYQYPLTYQPPSQCPSSNPGVLPINCEHTVPQSAFKRPGASEADAPMRSDVNHLFPTHSALNSARSNYGFAELNDTPLSDGTPDADHWCINTDCYTELPTTGSELIDAYSKYRLDPSSSSMDHAFEPRAAQKGNIARAIMYMYTMYKEELAAIALLKNPQRDPSIYPGLGVVDDFIDRTTLCAWDRDHPVTEEDKARNKRIKVIQGTGNPFIEHGQVLIQVSPTLNRTMCEIIMET